ncbi:MAG: hypothetical protein ACLPVF_20225 [Acidimicrobiales bacterium]
MPEPSEVPWRTIEESDRSVGGYCWQERRLFELTGAWAGGEGTGHEGTVREGKGGPEIRVFFSEASARHGFFATQWRDRLPVRAGLDVPALVRPPPGAVGPALDRLAQATGPLPRLAGLVVVLPRLLASYRRHLAGASPLSEAPVTAVLRLIDGGADRELSAGRDLVQRQLEAGADGGEVTQIQRDLERLFGEW